MRTHPGVGAGEQRDARQRGLSQDLRLAVERLVDRTDVMLGSAGIASETSDHAVDRTRGHPRDPVCGDLLHLIESEEAPVPRGSRTLPRSRRGSRRLWRNGSRSRTSGVNAGGGLGERGSAERASQAGARIDVSPITFAQEPLARASSAAASGRSS